MPGEGIAPWGVPHVSSPALQGLQPACPTDTSTLPLLLGRQDIPNPSALQQQQAVKYVKTPATSNMQIFAPVQQLSHF